MEVARTSMIHVATPHFLWSFAVQYAAHQLNLWPRVSLPETSPTLRWTEKVGDVSVFRVWGSRAFVRDTSADKLSPRTIPCVFLGFVPDAPGWHRFPLTVSSPTALPLSPPPPPLFLAPDPPPVDPLSPQGPVCPGVCVRSCSTPLLVSPPLAPEFSLAPPPWSPLPATPAGHALPPPCLWSSQVSASPPALACPALPSLHRGAAARHSVDMYLYAFI
ncbi:unnamed protein product [Closterium sp. NIES-53]